jgi:predicted transcriptional regulator
LAAFLTYAAFLAARLVNVRLFIVGPREEQDRRWIELECHAQGHPTQIWSHQGLARLAVCATICNITPIDPQTSENMRSESLPELGDLEREVMQLIWANGPLTAEFARERLARRLKESTVRTVLRRLEEKGYVNHALDGRTYVYQATHPRGKVAAKAVQRIIDLLCNGSVEEVLVGMVDNAMLDQRQLRALADKVAKAQTARR